MMKRCQNKTWSVPYYLSLLLPVPITCPLLPRTSYLVSPITSQQIRLDAAVVVPFVPLAEVIVAEAIGPGLVREQVDDAVLRLAFGAWDFRHGIPSLW